MALFDRFRATAPSIASEQEATRLIEQGHALEAEGKLDEAMQCYLEAIRLAPNPARGHLNRGNILLLQGNLDGALDAFRTALKFQPDYAGAHYNIGNALLGNRQFDEAVENYRSALQIKPDYAEALCALGVALKELGQLDEAVASFQNALLIYPALVEARLNLGAALQHYYNTGMQCLNDRKSQVAAMHFRKVLAIEPNLAEAHFNLGNALKELGQNQFAIDSYQQAIQIRTDYAEAHFNLGNTLKDTGQLDKAVNSFRNVLRINPDLVAAHNNLGLALQELGQLDNAMASYRRALEINPDFVDTLDNLLLSLNYSCSYSPADYLELSCQYGRIVASRVSARFSSWLHLTQPDRLRVGLVSGDMRKHSVGHFLEGLLSHIDPSRIELIAYATHHIEDELTERIRPYFSAWRPLLGHNDQSAAAMIHADGVHILIDVSGHTEHNRLPLFAWKPAPVQITWLGLPTTTGVSEIDYVLGDPHAIPPEFDEQFSESVWRLPDSYLCLTVPDSSVTVAELPARSNGYVTFGSFNNLTKMTDAVVAVWASILKSVPNSRLMLKAKQLNIPDIVEKTSRRFAACGISPDRLMLGGMLASRDDHLALYNKIDIALDTFPYPGVTTSAEALWMGVPVLGLRGDRFLSRTSESIAINAGLPGWIAADQDDYVAKAVAFASGLEYLAALRINLRQQVLGSPLFDAPRFARNFEDALWGMWQRYQASHDSREKP